MHLSILHFCIEALEGYAFEKFSKAVNELGISSGIAQELKGPITTIDKLIDAKDHTLITITSPHEEIVGYLKYGVKHLYFYRKNGMVEECSPYCLLDFYVKEDMQRSGLGLKLFYSFLEANNSTHPSKVAYDRPSQKLLCFVSKHFDLIHPDAQPNRYTIFEEFWAS